MTTIRNVARSQGALDSTFVSISCCCAIGGRYKRTLYELTDGDAGELLHLLNGELLPVDPAHLPYYTVTSRAPIGRR